MHPDMTDTKKPTVHASVRIEIDGVPTDLHGYAEDDNVDGALDLATEEAMRAVRGQRTSYTEAANRIGEVL